MSTWERAEFSAHLTEKEQETRNIRRLQIMMSMVMSVISQNRDLTVEEASEVAARPKTRGPRLFPRQRPRLRHSLQASIAAADERTLPAAVGTNHVGTAALDC